MSKRNMDTTFESWCQEWDALGVTPPENAIYQSLLNRYKEKHRAYHTLQHLEECLSLLRDAPSCSRSAEVSLALWFHDAIYDTKQSDNELRSADWLREVANEVGLSIQVADRLHALVMATQHAAEPKGLDAQILVDVDLSILGASESRFHEYEMQVRREYFWVPEAIYRLKRASLLKKFLDRPTLYHTPSFKLRFEGAARRNIQQSLMRLESESYAQE